MRAKGILFVTLFLLVQVAVVVFCQTAPPLTPNASLTPGSALPLCGTDAAKAAASVPGVTISCVTLTQICTPGYSSTVRNVSSKTKAAVFKEYAIVPKAGEFEIDHLVSLELGGLNSIENLWPQSYKTPDWNAHTKDDLENRLHYYVCHGHVDLPTAQKDIATDWIKAYKYYVQGIPTVVPPAPVLPKAPASPKG